VKRIAAVTVAVVCLLVATSAGAVTGQEKNAIRAARNYLSFSAFSRLGLIQQLSSSAGDGYPHMVAVAAVNSLKVNWNTEAVKAAKNYLKISSFSCSGLIQQLDSSAGDQFTLAQAKYGAKKAGAC
jgi:hypothetical protein